MNVSERPRAPKDAGGLGNKRNLEVSNYTDERRDAEGRNFDRAFSKNDHVVPKMNKPRTSALRNKDFPLTFYVRGSRGGVVPPGQRGPAVYSSARWQVNEISATRSNWRRP